MDCNKGDCTGCRWETGVHLQKATAVEYLSSCRSRVVSASIVRLVTAASAKRPGHDREPPRSRDAQFCDGLVFGKFHLTCRQDPADQARPPLFRDSCFVQGSALHEQDAGSKISFRARPLKGYFSSNKQALQLETKASNAKASSHIDARPYTRTLASRFANAGP